MLALALVAFTPLLAALWVARRDERPMFERSRLLRDGVTGTTRHSRDERLREQALALNRRP